MAREAAQRKSPPVVHRLPISQARINLGAVVNRAHLTKEYFILEKDGIPVAGLMDIDEFEDYLELQDPKIREHIRKSNQEYLAGKSRPLEQFRAERPRHKQGKTQRRRSA
ncbi:MAG: type II toxin-antitoxin system Phd/YefM family antitoxin [candidate division NC10 bacterium]|nr:type II toxin-antitoxin system Phd/YefM family antitoxin [candidate division NC10 bacterium]